MPRRAIASARRILLGAIGNLPLVLLCTFGYVVFFSQVWGPVRPWKVIVLALIVLGLCLGLDLGRFGGLLRLRTGPRRHAAAARAAWPPWRRAGALLAGGLLAFAGIYQSLGLEVNLAAYPLVSGLCLIVSVGVGGLLLAAAWPRERWRRKTPRVPRTRGSRHRGGRVVDVRAPRRTPGAGGSTFHLPMPRETGFQARWGGVGSAPAPRIWTPGGRHPAEGTLEPVPERLRRVHLLRRVRSKMAPTSPWATLLFVLILAAVLAAALWLWSGA